MTKEIIYFEKIGKVNTGTVLEAAIKRANELNITDLVIASDTGKTGLELVKLVNKVTNTGKMNIVVVTQHAGAKGNDKILIQPEYRKEIEELGGKVLISSHALSGVARSVMRKFGGICFTELIAFTFRLFGEGIKVAVEVSVMAADAGLMPTAREIIAIGGSWSGADSAIVLKTAHMNNFFEMEIKEIIAKPREIAQAGDVS